VNSAEMNLRKAKQKLIEQRTTIVQDYVQEQQEVI